MNVYMCTCKIRQVSAQAFGFSYSLVQIEKMLLLLLCFFVIVANIVFKLLFFLIYIYDLIKIT